MNNDKELIKELDSTLEQFDALSKTINNASEYYEKYISEFNKLTSLNAKDHAFLFFATALQCARTVIINNLISYQKAGNKNKIENKLHEEQQKIMNKFKVDDNEISRPYYASMKQIITTKGVPYDAQTYFDKKYNLLKGANHRFLTFGHTLIAGLLFGTCNIMTNTVTVFRRNSIPRSHHVIYDELLKNPRIGLPASTTVVLINAGKRAVEDPKALVASLIKQLIHMGTDMFTKAGIHLPGLSLILEPNQIESITKYIGASEIVKAGASATVDIFINYIIAVLHRLTYNEQEDESLDLFKIRTNKIIDYSLGIAQTVNAAIVAGKMLSGNEAAIRELDWGGLIVLVTRIISDKNYQDEIEAAYLKKCWSEELELLKEGEDKQCLKE